MKNTTLILFVLVFLSLSTNMAFAADKTPIDQVPFYGGMDRNSFPELKKADEELISGAAKEFGSRESASKAWVERGFRLYDQNDYITAMKRFNQAWLLDPKNPDVYFGFGAMLHDKGDNCGALEMMEKAYDLGVNDAGFLADLGRVSTLCAVNGKSTEDKKKLIEKSEELYKTALNTASNNRIKTYVLASWSSAYYWQENYTGSWDMVHRAEKLGGAVPSQFRKNLEQKMTEPK
jgi:tetratricopeptide (TPR) repeat protein